MEASIFGRLPVEIRVEIFQLILHEPLTIRYCVQQDRLAVIQSEACSGGSAPSIADCRPPLAINLLGVCRAIRHEALEIYLQKNCVTFYGTPSLRTTFERFWTLFDSLKSDERELARRPRSVTIWLGGYLTVHIAYWNWFRMFAGTFHLSVIVRLVVGFHIVHTDYPDSYTQFGLDEFAFYYSHLQDADRKLNQLIGQSREKASLTTRTVAIKLGISSFIGRMPTFRRRGDISKPFEVGLPSQLDTLYTPELQKKHCRQEGLQMYDFVPESFWPDELLLSPRASSQRRLVDKASDENEEQSSQRDMKQVWEADMTKVVERAVDQAIEEVKRQIREGPVCVTKGAVKRVIREGTAQAVNKATRRVNLSVKKELRRVTSRQTM